MNDTPEYIKQLQLEIWLSKTPAQRLRQFMEDNDALYRFWDCMKASSTPPKEGFMPEKMEVKLYENTSAEIK